MSPRVLVWMVWVVALVAFPVHADPALDRGIQLFDQGKNEEARAVLTPLAKAQPPNASAAYHLGRIAMRADAAKEAARWFEVAVAAEPANASYHLWLGRAYGTQARRANKLSQLGLAKKTRKEFERASELDPNDLDARESLVDYYLQAPGIAGGSVEKAKLQAAEIKKRSAYHGALTEAKIAEDQKDMAGAERALQAAARAQPDSLGAQYALGNFYVRSEKYDQALDVFEGILARKPGDHNALYLIGRTGAVSGLRLARAEEALNAYLALPVRENTPPPAGAHWRLGMVHEKAGKKDLARAEYRKSLALDPKFEEAKKSLAKLD